jgi:hypothetical protein
VAWALLVAIRGPMVSTRLRWNKVRTSGQERTPRRVGLLVVVVLLGGCRPDPHSPRGAAERFLDAHYVAIDLAAALPLTTGLARAKVEHERALVGGVAIDETTRKPRVWYRLLEERPLGDDGVQLLYRGTLSPEGVERFHRRWLVTVRREPSGWIVSNFEELPD